MRVPSGDSSTRESSKGGASSGRGAGVWGGGVAEAAARGGGDGGAGLPAHAEAETAMERNQGRTRVRIAFGAQQGRNPPRRQALPREWPPDVDTVAKRLADHYKKLSQKNVEDWHGKEMTS